MTEPFEIEVSGKSMAPWLSEGDRVFVQPLLKWDEFPIGGIVLLRDQRNQRLLLHRKIWHNRTKGDKNRFTDGPVPSRDLRPLGLLTPWHQNQREFYLVPILFRKLGLLHCLFHFHKNPVKLSLSPKQMIHLFRKLYVKPIGESVV